MKKNIRTLKKALKAKTEEAQDIAFALRDLYDEQNDAPLERRRPQWESAMEQAETVLKMYKH